MKKNFAQQPDGGGMINILTANDLSTDITNFNSNNIFQKRPNFIDNCKNNDNCNCKNCNTMKNANGFANATGYDEGGSSILDGFNLNSLINSAATIYGTSQQIKLAQETKAIKDREEEIARQNAAIERQRTQQAELGSGGAVAKIKAYALPIAITGGVIIVGIAAYFFFKKKKIN